MTRHNAQTRTGPPGPFTAARRVLPAMILALAACTGVALRSARADAGASIAYQNPFLEPVGDEWSPVRESTAPNGERYLGPYHNQTVTLTLGDLPEHQYMVIAFDLYAIGDWPGDRGPTGRPTAFNVTIDGVESLLNASIATDNGDASRTQSFPDDMGKKVNFAECGVYRINALGLVEQGSRTTGDATYRVILALRHSGTNVRIDLTASGLGPDESVATWGLDNVAVEVSSGQLYPEMSVLGPTDLESYFSEFYSGGPIGSNPARNLFIPPPSSVDDPGDVNPTSDPPPPPVPAPGTALGVAMLGAGLLRRRRRAVE